MVGSSGTSRQLPGAVGFRADGDGALPGDRVVRWPGGREPSVITPDAAPDRRGPGRYCYLLDEDDDLADAFDGRLRRVVRQVATARVLELSGGSGWPDEWSPTSDGALGTLILEGLLAVDVHVGDRTATELLGPGDLLQPPRPDIDQLIERDVIHRALLPSRVAVLDAGFLDRVRPWPEIVLTLLRRSDKRALDLDLQRAVNSHPSLELRLALVLWHLAERWGRVERGGVRIELPLTHALLGRLVAAERPSVSRSLGRLADHGLVTGGAGHWHLAGSAASCLSQLGARHGVHALHESQRVDGSPGPI